MFSDEIGSLQPRTAYAVARTIGSRLQADRSAEADKDRKGDQPHGHIAADRRGPTQGRYKEAARAKPQGKGQTAGRAQFKGTTPTSRAQPKGGMIVIKR